MIFSRKKSSSTEKDIEHGVSQQSSTPGEPQVHVDHSGRPEFAVDDQLNLFRHLVGIISHESMVHSHFDSGGRPAPNLGIYARVVHNENDAKIGYKYFSWLINGCLGLQIIVAAALTAMGAAGAGRSAVTVFGAINTVIAGVLTFLKGSGLPNRLKYYQTEWKRVREFIEQRERDFSQPGCDLDLHGVVAMVESMYEEVKIDLEASTPDRFAGFGSARKGQQVEPMTTKPASFTLPRLGEKLKELQSGLGRADDEITQRARDVQRHTEDGVDRIESSFDDKMKDLASKANLVVQDFRTHGQGHVEDVSRQANAVVQDFKTQGQGHFEDIGRQASDYADRLERAASSRLGGPITINMPGSTHRD